MKKKGKGRAMARDRKINWSNYVQFPPSYNDGNDDHDDDL